MTNCACCSKSVGVIPSVQFVSAQIHRPVVLQMLLCLCFVVCLGGPWSLASVCKAEFKGGEMWLSLGEWTLTLPISISGQLFSCISFSEESTVS